MTSRRLFLKSGTMAMLSLGFAPSFLARAAEAAAPRRRLLVALFQRGAVDGLNMVVPYGEADYYRLRPSIAVARPGVAGGALDLDGFFGLHPRMRPLQPFWRNRSLAVVHACGSPDATRSHFDAQDYMETATPGVKRTPDGWVNRYLQAHPAERNPLRGVAIGRQMPRALQGRAPSLAFAGVDAFAQGGTRVERVLDTVWARDPHFGGAASEASEAMRLLRTTAVRDVAPGNGAAYPRSAFGQALREIARLAKADVGLEIAFAESGNWDHHAGEGGSEGQLAGRLDDLARGIAALAADLGDRMADTVVMTMSEFGRTVAENGTRGTDHGHGNALLVLGGPVKGGRVHGRWPGLGEDDRYEGRDLAVTTDFRDVFAEVVTGHLGASPDALARIFPGHRPGASLGLF
jgi:uncharacterized protein (DUF1501 family)